MKKKKGKTDKKVGKKKVSNELETVTFEQQIIDNNRQLARLRTRNEELEADAENLKEKLKQLEENKADLTSHLQQILQRKMEEAQELQERLIALEKLRKEEQKAFKIKEESLEHEFKLMENNLKAEITLAAGKLNALEDFRVAKIDLMKKFEEQEEQMAEQESRHKDALYEAEKKLTIAKAKMQTELEKRLSELAASFRAASGLRLAEATQRAVRENVALQQELDALLSHCRQLNDTMEDCRENERDLRLRAALYEAEAKLALDKIMQQNRKIEQLTREHASLLKAIVRSRKVDEYQAQFVAHTFKEIQVQKNVVSFNKAILRKKNIHNVYHHRQLQGGKRDVREDREDFRRVTELDSVLSRAKYAIQQAFLVQSAIEAKEERKGDNDYDEDQACKYCFTNFKDKLLQTLLQILSEGDFSPNLAVTNAEVESTPSELFYQIGNLGLIPSFFEEKSREIRATTGLLEEIDFQENAEEKE